MLNEISKQFEIMLYQLSKNFYYSLSFVGILWGIHLINYLTRYRLNHLGIIVRSIKGLGGIFLAPFLHADWNHLFFNSVPLFGLADLLLTRGVRLFSYLTGWVMISSGLAIWLLGRKGIQIGASSLIMGYFGYLVSEAYFHRTTQSIILLILVLYYFGGLIFSIFPQKKNVSFEGHCFGFLSGILFAYWLYR